MRDCNVVSEGKWGVKKSGFFVNSRIAAMADSSFIR